MYKVFMNEMQRQIIIEALDTQTRLNRVHDDRHVETVKVANLLEKGQGHHIIDLMTSLEDVE